MPVLPAEELLVEAGEEDFHRGSDRKGNVRGETVDARRACWDSCKRSKAEAEADCNVDVR